MKHENRNLLTKLNIISLTTSTNLLSKIMILCKFEYEARVLFNRESARDLRILWMNLWMRWKR